jgi:hypothetical protein
MHHDLQRGRPLEIRWLSGGVVQLGNAVRVATPLNRDIADVLAPCEAGAPAASRPKASSAPMRGDRGVTGAHLNEKCLTTRASAAGDRPCRTIPR